MLPRIASQELVSEFNKLLADDSLFGLLVTIRSESLAPLTTLPSTSSDFASNLSSLAPHLQPNEALYVLLKRHPDAPRLVAVSYVPDAAKVRQKMLFASTRLTLVRELGSEHFRETIFATTAEELGPQGFAKHDRHTELEAPLTEEERTLGEVKRAEAEAGAGMGQREIHLSKNLKMPVATDALVALSEMGREQGTGLVMLVCPTCIYYCYCHYITQRLTRSFFAADNQPAKRSRRTCPQRRVRLVHLRARVGHADDGAAFHLLAVRAHAPG